MIQLKDSRGHLLSFDSPPKRVVSLIPSITESLFELGVGDRVAGISKYCIYPEAGVQSKMKVGGQKNPDFEAIEKINPDLIILNEEENKPEHIEYFQKKYRTFVTYPRKYADTESLLIDLGRIFDVSKLAEHYIDRFKKFSTKEKPLKTMRALYLIWRNPWMSINGDTFIHDVLVRFGFENVFGNRKDRYFEVTAEEIEQANPEVIILPNEPYNFLEKHIKEFETLNTDAMKNKRVFLVDGTYFCWYGTRMAKTNSYIQEHISSRLNLN